MNGPVIFRKLFIPFQFHYGSITGAYEVGYSNVRSLFQFHRGTITSSALIYAGRSVKKLKFHYGAIACARKRRVTK